MQKLATLAFSTLSLMGMAQDRATPPGQLLCESASINKKLPPFTFEIESAKPDEITIRITGGPKAYKGQTITTSVEDPQRHAFHLVDVNLDGYDDFAVLENRGATGNVNYDYWVFDPIAGIFREGGEFANITEVDADHKLLISQSKGGNIEKSTRYYRVRHGKPVLIKSVEVRWAREVRDVVPAQVSDDTPVAITRTYDDGKLQRTFYNTTIGEE